MDKESPHALPSESNTGIASSEFAVVVLSVMRHWRFVAVITGVISLSSLVVAIALPNWYTATAKLMPPQQSQSNAMAVVGQLGALAPAASQALNLKNPSDIYVAMLKSRTIADNLISQFALKAIYGEEFLQDARRELARNSHISASREGVITIQVEDKDPQRSADLANGYVEELRKLTSTLAVSEASQRRHFFEGQLKKAKSDLATAEVELKKYTQKSGLVSPQGQISLSVSAAATLRAQIAAKEIQLGAMRTFATDSNPELYRVTRELSGLRSELAKMEGDPRPGKGDVLVPFDKAPEVGMEYIRRYRDTKYFETLYEVLAKQYEIARIDEAKDATLIQPLDVASRPERKSRPQITLIFLTGTLGGLILAVLILYFVSNVRKLRARVS